MVGLTWGLTHLLGGRAAYIQVGACIGTIMVANVFFLIIPGQRRMVAAMRAGRTPNPIDGQRAKQRSVHNNYFTLPVLLTMIGNHYAATYSHPQAWAVLALIGAAGVSIRHFFNLKHKGVYRWQYPALGAVLLGVTVLVDRARASSRSRQWKAWSISTACAASSGSAAWSATRPRRRFPASPRRPPGSCSSHSGGHPEKRPARLPAGDRDAHHAARQRHADDGARTRRDRRVGQGRGEGGLEDSCSRVAERVSVRPDSLTASACGRMSPRGHRFISQPTERRPTSSRKTGRGR